MTLIRPKRLDPPNKPPTNLQLLVADARVQPPTMATGPRLCGVVPGAVEVAEVIIQAAALMLWSPKTTTHDSQKPLPVRMKHHGSAGRRVVKAM
ncbi:MAG: hypothetical protein HOF43_13735 [Chloroflexi bacterium]|nr:hypothetical protein [Chloroflexota bacterium]